MRWRTAIAAAALGLGGGLLAAQWGVSAPPAFRTGSRSIGGVVVSERTGQALSGGTVSLRSVHAPDRSASLDQTTGADGRFSFENLPDGRYALYAIRPGYAGSFYDEHPGGTSTAVVTGDGLDTSGLRLVLRQLGSMHGTISDDSGDPVPQARVELFRGEGSESAGKMTRAAVVTADPEGNYEFSRLTPGTYFLCVFGRPWYATRSQANRIDAQGEPQQVRSPLDVAYPMTCSPGVTDATQADAITVGPGERVPVSLSMHAVPALHVAVEVPRQENGQGFPFPRMRQRLFGTEEFVQPMMGSMLSRMGREGQPMMLEMAVAPGQYEVEIPGRNGDAGRFTTLDASTDGATVDLTGAEGNAQVSGRVRVATGGALPAGFSLQFILESNEVIATTRVEADGRFSAREVRPGDYRVAAFAPRQTLYIERMTVNGSAIRGGKFAVGRDPVILDLTVGQAMAAVKGYARRNGQPAPGAFLALIPRDPARLPILNQSDSDSSFEFPHIAPGTYTLVAIEDGWTLDRSQRESFLPYLAKGIVVVVPRGASSVPLKGSIEVQPK